MTNAGLGELIKRADLTRSPVWARLRFLWSGGIRQRVTKLGLAFSMVIIVVGLAAFLSANNLLFLLLALLISTFLISGVISRLGLYRLDLGFSLPEHVAAKQPIVARVRVVNAKTWMSSFSIHLRADSRELMPTPLYYPVIAAGAAHESSVKVEFPRRGLYRDNHFFFSTSFPFGFTERRLPVPLAGEIVVYPSIRPKPEWDELFRKLEGELTAHRRGRGDDFYRLRPYEHGESARRVDWKSTAHTGTLQVREYTESQDPLVHLMLDLERNGPDFDAWFEDAVEGCAYLAWSLSQRGARVRLRTQVVDLRVPDDGDVYTILKYLALVEPLAPGSPEIKNSPANDEATPLEVLFRRPADGVAAGGANAAVSDT
jgi:uncharacterized protein (DUF58 family)